MPQRTSITDYRALPPRWRIIYPEDPEKITPERYLEHLDESLAHTQLRMGYTQAADLVSLVFSNQAISHELVSRQAAELIRERQGLAQRHLMEIQLRLDELMEQRLLPNARYGGKPALDQAVQDIERRIVDMEKQRRDVQITLWRDILDLRKDLLTERREYQSTRNRMHFLGGVADGGN